MGLRERGDRCYTLGSLVAPKKSSSRVRGMVAAGYSSNLWGTTRSAKDPHFEGFIAHQAHKDARVCIRDSPRRVHAAGRRHTAAE